MNLPAPPSHQTALTAEPLTPANTLIEWLSPLAKTTQAMIIQTTPQGRLQLSGEDLWQQSDALAVAFQQQGLQAGDRVGLLLGQQHEMITGLLACRKAGLVPVPINLLWPKDDMTYVMNHAGIKGLITDAAFAPQLLGSPWGLFKKLLQGKTLPLWVANVTQPSWHYRVIPTLRPLEPTIAKRMGQSPQPVTCPTNHLALLLYTSGTTAKPKGVMLSENNLLSNISGLLAIDLLRPEDKALMALPLFHSYGQILTWLALGCGVPLVLEPSFHPKALLKRVQEESVTVLPLVPSILGLLAEGLQKSEASAQTVIDGLKTLRVFVSGGAALPSATLETLWQKTQIPVLEGYGLTETAPVVAVNRLSSPAPKAGTVGPPLPNVHVRLNAHNLNEIEVSGPNVMLGYYRDEAATKAVMTLDGWFKTGDAGEWDAEGRLKISGGRLKELIIKDGENISPLRVEDALMQHPAIAAVCVVGLPSPTLNQVKDRGERIGAALVLQTSPEISSKQILADIKHWVRETLPPLLQPDEWQLLDELPKNATGKVLRRSVLESWPNSL
ncbi:MAG: class I adenylate-forming enzyme family protein [Vampirovibrionales bacterium]